MTGIRGMSARIGWRQGRRRSRWGRCETDFFWIRRRRGCRRMRGIGLCEIAAVVYEKSFVVGADEGGRFHVYLNPEREVDEEAREVHGLDAEFLGDKPLFREVAEKFVDFLQGGHLYIHNAKFDLDFLNAELGRLDLPPVEECCETVVCTLEWSRQNNRGIAKP